MSVYYAAMEGRKLMGKDVERLRQWIANLKDELKAIEKRLDGIEELVDITYIDWFDETEKLIDILMDKNTEIAQLKFDSGLSHLGRLESEIGRLKYERDSAVKSQRKVINQQKEQIKGLQRELSKKQGLSYVVEFEEKIRALRVELRARDAEITKLKAKLAAKDDEIAKLKAEDDIKYDTEKSMLKEIAMFNAEIVRLRPPVDITHIDWFGSMKLKN